jgi:hypothetical protein
MVRPSACSIACRLQLVPNELDKAVKPHIFGMKTCQEDAISWGVSCIRRSLRTRNGCTDTILLEI